jgi:hypothetical protein
MLIIVAVLAVVGGLAIVAITSPQSLDSLASLFGAASATPAATATVAPSATPTLEQPPTATVEVSPTRRPTLSAPLVTSTLPPATATPAAVASPTATEIQLPSDAEALAEVQVEQAVNGRVRDLPNGDTVVAVVPNGTQLYVLSGREQIDNVVWMEVRLLDGTTTGWMADFLLKIVYSRTP